MPEFIWEDESLLKYFILLNRKNAPPEIAVVYCQEQAQHTICYFNNENHKYKKASCCRRKINHLGERVTNRKHKDNAALEENMHMNKI